MTDPAGPGPAAPPPLPAAATQPVLETTVVRPAGWTAPRRVTVGTLLGRTFRIWRANLGPFTGVALVAHLASLGIGLVLVAPLVLTPQRPFATPSPETAQLVFTWRYWAYLALSGVLLALQVGAMSHGVADVYGGGRPRVGGMLALAARRGVPLVVTGLLALLAFYAGLVLLLVPGIIFGVLFSLALPAVAVEGLGPIRALSRSSRLTRGRRLTLLGFFTVMFLVAMGIGTAVTLLAAAIPPVGTVLGSIATAFVTPLYVGAAAVAFHDLREEKEGTDTATLEQVFE